VTRPGISGAGRHVAVRFVGPKFQGLPRMALQGPVQTHEMQEIGTDQFDIREIGTRVPRTLKRNSEPGNQNHSSQA
jgi:hypothetical protein